MRYLTLILVALFLLGGQMMISNLLFFGKLVLELPLILVIYAGFNLTWVRGGIFSAIIGLCQDCLMGSVSGLFALVFLLIFFISKFVFPRVYGEKCTFIMIFVGFCAFVEGVLILSFYELAFDLDKFHQLWDVFLPQAIMAGLISPVFFSLFRKFKVFPHGGITRSFERSAIR